jgi:putative hydrolase of the HAD superfamily
MDYESKPQPAAYRRICELLAIQPELCLLVEDNIHNLLPAKALGMVTVLVQAGDNAPGDGVDYVISCVEEIAQVIEALQSAAPPNSPVQS